MSIFAVGGDSVGSAMISEMAARTPQCALDNLEVADVAQEVRCARSVGIPLLLLRSCLAVSAVGVSVDTVSPGAAVGEVDWDHLGRIVGSGVAVSVRAHFELS